MKQVLLLLLLFLTACVPMPETSFHMQTVTAEMAETLTAQSPPLALIAATATVPPTATPEPRERYIGLLLGLDRGATRPEAPGYGVRSDAFIIVVADVWPSRMRITFLSVPRDLFVDVPCEYGGQNRVNAAWYRGGFDCLRQTIKFSFGLTVNAPIAILDMQQYMALVDRMGGLHITPDVTHSDPCGDETLVWNAGTGYDLSGLEALCYVRGRRAYGGDLDRNRRVLEVVRAALLQWPAAIAHDPARAVDLYKSLKEQAFFQTDADLGLIVSLLTLLPRLPDAEMRLLHYGLEDVDFASDPVYGSILIAKHDLPTWTACLLEGEGDCGS